MSKVSKAILAMIMIFGMNLCAEESSGRSCSHSDTKLLAFDNFREIAAVVDGQSPEDLWQGETACLYPLSNDNFYLKHAQNLRSVGNSKKVLIHGIDFQDESSKLLDLFAELIKYPEQDGLQKIKKQNCHKVICALEILFEKKTVEYELDGAAKSKVVGGAEVAHKALYLLDRYNINISHMADHLSSSSLMSHYEVNQILKGVNLFPKDTFPLKSRPLFLSHNSRGKQSPRTNASGRFFGPHEIGGKYARIEFNKDTGSTEHFLHEVGHFIDWDSISTKPEFKGRGFGDSPAWLSASGGWSSEGPGDLSKFPRTKEEKDNGYVPYGASGQFEDFTESILYYRLEPLNLWKVSPEKYNFIKKHVFKGVEYLNNDQCQNNSEVPEGVSSDLKASLWEDDVDNNPYVKHEGILNNCRVISPSESSYVGSSCSATAPYFISNRVKTEFVGDHCYESYARAVEVMLKEKPSCQKAVNEKALDFRALEIDQAYNTGKIGGCYAQEITSCPETHKWSGLINGESIDQLCHSSQKNAVAMMLNHPKCQ